MCKLCANKKNIKLYTIVGQPQVSSPFLLHLKIWVEKIVMNANIKLSLVKRKKRNTGTLLKPYGTTGQLLQLHQTNSNRVRRVGRDGQEEETYTQTKNLILINFNSLNERWK